MVVVRGVPYIRQKQNDTCSVACLCMAYAFRFPDLPALEEAELVQEMLRSGLFSEIEEHGVWSGGVYPNAAYTQAEHLNLEPQWLPTDTLEAEIELALNAGNIVYGSMTLDVFGYYVPDGYKYHAVLIVGLSDDFVYLLDPDDPLHKFRSPRLLSLLGEEGCRRLVNRRGFFDGWRASLDPNDADYSCAAFKI